MKTPSSNEKGVISQWVAWKEENKRAYLWLVNGSTINGFLLGVVVTLLIIMYL